ncbi:MAG: hypothetical protein PHI35_00715 [Victivallaceae bacterium]|nr:hypothetical protein [Victivallaceae bacterium]
MKQKTPAEISALVAAGIFHERVLKAAEKNLNAIKRELIEAAQDRPDDLLPTEGGGHSLTFEADDGSAACVMFPARTLKAAINPETKDGAKIMDTLRESKDDLFTPVLLYAPVEKFRDKVRELFNKRVADSIIKKCESDSSPRVAFETVDRSAEKDGAGK